MRGEYFEYERPPLRPLGSPPLARGVQTTVAHYFGYEGIIPACAGSTTKIHSGSHHHKDHPRLRGEYQRNSSQVISWRGSSPLTRGVQSDTFSFQAGSRIIPAYAGSTDLVSILKLFKQDHPRLRGEYQQELVLVGSFLGSSPLTRGVLPDPVPSGLNPRIIPAYAGSTHRVSLPG